MASKFIGITTAALLLVSGCARTIDEKSALAGSITVAGSTSVQPISEVLAEHFTLTHPGVRINVQGGGSSGGIKAARELAADLGASSRPLKPEEKGLHEFIIAWDGIAVIVHPTSPLRSLSLDEVKAVFAGSVVNWRGIGGPEGTIMVVTREEGSGTRGAFEEIVMGKDPITDRAIVLNSTGAVAAAVAGDPLAIGYVSLAAVRPGIAALSIDGVMPSAEAIASGRYRIARPFLYLTAAAPEGVVRAFLDFILSPEGQAIVEREGLVPVN
ncbi:MAG: phosphate ABC transporter substrate-binding protein [bacterium]|nr:phosphate ABC transporter substrate-binding protein [bacterium]